MNRQPELSTPCLLLKGLTLDDQTAIHALHTNPTVQRFLSRKPPADLAATKAFIQKIQAGVAAKRWYYWGLYLSQETEQLIGTICLWQFNDVHTTAEVGFDLLPEYQGQGLMSEALRTVLQFADADLPLQTISGLVHADNEACIRLLRQHQFTFLRRLTPEEKFTAEQNLPILHYERLRE